MQGESEGTEMTGEHPLGTNTQLETSSSEQEPSIERKGHVVMFHEKILGTIFPLLTVHLQFRPQCVNKKTKQKTSLLDIYISHAGMSMQSMAHFVT